eukprot:GHVL01033618.1.p1 GENE.GHVL01033618.1~~GHVL01033618.1.p1  ORF type:complete len:495 (+),score=110.91 GHVL01033618.1:106-1590(+)
MYRICVVGSGPGGFYTSKYLLQHNIKINMLEQYPFPYGLIRSGVAPDHPEVKNVLNDFKEVGQHKNFTFYGNVSLGNDISLAELKKRYDGVVLALGAQADKRLGIPGEDCNGIYTSREIVHWYNGHPWGSRVKLPENPENAVIIGNGNVSLDIARIILSEPDRLKSTDISLRALEYLNRIKKVTIIGRRGAMQASFANKELREALNIPNVLAIMDPQDEIESYNDASLKESDLSRRLKRSKDLYKKMVQNWSQNSSKILEFKFFQSPVSFSKSTSDWVTSIEFQKNRLDGPPNYQKIIPISDKKPLKLDTSLVVTSIGYNISHLDGIPLQNGRVPHINGRVLTNDEQEGLFVSGWIKRGPLGIINTNVSDAKETAETVLEFLKNKKKIQEISLVNILNTQKEVISFDEWLVVEEAERKRGQELGKSALKFENVEEILKIAKNGQKNIFKGHEHCIERVYLLWLSKLRKLSDFHFSDCYSQEYERHTNQCLIHQD